MIKKLVIFQWNARVGVEHCISEVEAEVMKCKLRFDEDLMLCSECCKMICVKVLEVFDEGLALPRRTFRCWGERCHGWLWALERFCFRECLFRFFLLHPRSNIIVKDVGEMVQGVFVIG